MNWVLVAWFSKDGPGGEHRFVCTDGLNTMLENADLFGSKKLAQEAAAERLITWAHPVKVDDLDAWVVMKTLAAEVGGVDLREVDCSRHGVRFWDGKGCSVCSREGERTQGF